MSTHVFETLASVGILSSSLASKVNVTISHGVRRPYATSSGDESLSSVQGTPEVNIREFAI